MTRKIVAAALAATLALGPLSAAPARAADGEDIAKAILGATALFVIVNEIDKDKKRKSYRDVQPAQRDWRDAWGNDRHRYQNRHRSSREIPAYCVNRIETRKGPRFLVGERCAEKAGARNLPKHCEVDIRGRHSQRDVYGLRCLKNEGYRVEARRR